jgi:aldehyde dehydrogenase (NAD+)
MASVLPLSTEPRVRVSANKLLINNRWIPSESGKTFATINPSTGEEICQVAEAEAADVDKSRGRGARGFRARSLEEDGRFRARASPQSSRRPDRNACR